MFESQNRPRRARANRPRRTATRGAATRGPGKMGNPAQNKAHWTTDTPMNAIKVETTVDEAIAHAIPGLRPLLGDPPGSSCRPRILRHFANGSRVPSPVPSKSAERAGTRSYPWEILRTAVVVRSRKGPTRSRAHRSEHRDLQGTALSAPPSSSL